MIGTEVSEKFWPQVWRAFHLPTRVEACSRVGMRILWIIAIVLAVASLARADEDVLELILVAGQSNAVGFDANPAFLPKSDHDAEVKFWYRCGDPPVDDHDISSSGKWIALAPQPKGSPKEKSSAPRQYGNFSTAEGGFGPEIGLARALREQQPDRRIAVIKIAFSGTAIGTDWNPDAQEGDVQGDCYRALVAEVKTAIAAAITDGESIHLRAFAWVQGESDANAVDAPLYARRLTHLIANLRTALAAPDMIALLAVNTQFSAGKNKHMPAIVGAQQVVANTDPQAVYIDTSKATIANAVHFDAQGTLDVGKWFAEGLIKLEASKVPAAVK